VTVPLLEVRDLWAGYENTMVIRGLSFSMQAGDSAVVIGPNGHGKTTLLRTISGLIKPVRGDVLWNGEPIGGRRPERISNLGLVHVPQGDGLFAEMTVAENLMMGAFPPGAWGRREAALERVYSLFPGVHERAGQRARTLSGGERRMTALGRGLMREPRLLMIDEPSLGLAPVMIDAIYRGIAELKAASTTLLLVEENFTHIQDLADVVHVVEMGRIIRSGTFEELSQDRTVVETYLGSL
jgi:branched-chain amino acid transport system ATP-binding protein